MAEPEAPKVPLSSHFITLRDRLDDLRKCFLPLAFDSLGNYPPEQTTKTHAYRVLSHAELEGFLEARAQEIAVASARVWKGERRASRTLVCLLAFSGRSHDAPPPTLAAPQPNKKDDWEDLLEIDHRIDAAVNAYIGRLKMNHGVKEENVLGLLLPIGVARFDLDPQLLAELNSFGSARGQSAHLGVVHLKEVPDPLTEHQRVEQIATLLAPLDVCLTLLSGSDGSTT